MKRYQIIIFLVFILTTMNISGQEKKANFGVKGGVNIGKYTPDKNTIDYDHKLGFFIGGFSTIKIDKNWNFQPELLFALQGSQVNVKGLNIPSFDYQGNPINNSNTYNYEYEINELTITIPLLFQLNIYKDFYLESGFQFGYIIDRNLSSSYHIISGQDNSFIIQDGDNFDFGVNLGIGYNISKKVSLNYRTFWGLIKRDDEIKSLVFNLGIEYNL